MVSFVQVDKHGITILYHLHHCHTGQCAGSNKDLCTVYKNSECCGEAAPATMAHLGNHQCVVSMCQKMLPVCCNEIPQ